MLGPTMEPIGGSRRIGWWLGLVAIALVVGAATAWFMTPRQTTDDTASPAAEATTAPVAAASESTAPAAATDPEPPAPPPSATVAASVTPPAPPASAPGPTATAALSTTSPVHRPKHPPAPRAPATDPAHTGLLTVICMPACDQVLDGSRSLGPSPIFKLPVATGSHRLTLRTLDPPVEKMVEVTVTTDETTVLRYPMGK
jgi:hypothetical protein